MSSHWKISSNGFIEVDITQYMRDLADQRNAMFYKKYGDAGTHRKNKDRQRTTGYLAEAAVKSVYNQLEFSGDDRVDFIFDGKSFDVKAQGCNSQPAKDYVGTLYAEQKNRLVDFLIFTRVKNDFSKVWIAGIIAKDEFLRRAVLVQSGVANNNFTYDQARYEIQYKDLTLTVRNSNSA